MSNFLILINYFYLHLIFFSGYAFLFRTDVASSNSYRSNSRLASQGFGSYKCKFVFQYIIFNWHCCTLIFIFHREFVGNSPLRLSILCQLRNSFRGNGKVSWNWGNGTSSVVGVQQPISNFYNSRRNSIPKPEFQFRRWSRARVMLSIGQYYYTVYMWSATLN